MRRIDRIYVHCAATRPGQDIGLKEITRWHMQGRGWNRVGYHRIVRISGLIEIGLPLERAGIHVKGDNRNSIGICMAGGIDNLGQPEANFTDAQWQSLRVIKQYFDLMFPDAEWRGHRDHPKARKACPSFDLAEWLAGEGFKTGGGF